MSAPSSQYHKLYDRFGTLFLVTVATVSLLLLVDLNQDQGIAEVLSLVVTMLAAVTLFLAVAVAGVGILGRRVTLSLIVVVVGAAIVSLVFTNVPNGHGGFLWLVPVSYTHLRAHETNESISYAVFCL